MEEALRVIHSIKNNEMLKYVRFNLSIVNLSIVNTIMQIVARNIEK